MSFRVFRLQLAKQMVHYDPSKSMYPGDDKMRAYTQKHKKRRSSNDNTDGQNKEEKRAKHNKVTEVTFDSFEGAIHSGRLCLTVNGLQEHFKSVERATNAGKCEVCCGFRDRRWLPVGRPTMSIGSKNSLLEL